MYILSINCRYKHTVYTRVMNRLRSHQLFLKFTRIRTLIGIDTKNLMIKLLKGKLHRNSMQIYPRIGSFPNINRLIKNYQRAFIQKVNIRLAIDDVFVETNLDSFSFYISHQHRHQHQIFFFNFFFFFFKIFFPI